LLQAGALAGMADVGVPGQQHERRRPAHQPARCSARRV